MLEWPRLNSVGVFIKLFYVQQMLIHKINHISSIEMSGMKTNVKLVFEVTTNKVNMINEYLIVFSYFWLNIKWQTFNVVFICHLSINKFCCKTLTLGILTVLHEVK